MLDVALDWANQSNFKKVRVEAESTYPSLRKLYSQAGFRDKLVRDDVSDQLVKVMEKTLVSVPEYFQL